MGKFSYLVDDEEELKPKTDLALGESREDTINSLFGDLGASRKAEKEAASQYLEPAKLSYQDTLATIGVPLAATLLGAALRGKKGAMIGAQSGLSGAAVGLKGMSADAEKEKARSKLRLESAQETTKDVTGQIRQQREGIFRQKERKEIQEENPGGGTGIERALGDEGAKKHYNLLTQNLEEQIQQKNAIPAAEFKGIQGSKQRLFNYGDLKTMVTEGVDAEGLHKLGKEFQSEMAKLDPNDNFRPMGAISDILARSGIKPNSETAQVFMEALRMGRAVAVAQAGVATNQDVEQETSNLLPRPLESTEVYLKRLGRMQTAEQRTLKSSLNDQLTQGRTAAKDLMTAYEGLGLFGGEAVDTKAKVVGAPTEKPRLKDYDGNVEQYQKDLEEYFYNQGKQ